MKDETLYRLSDFDVRDIDRAKKYIRSAFLGYMTATLDNKIDLMINQLRKTFFTAEDILSFDFRLDIIGNDLLAAIGAACNDREGTYKETL